MENKEEARQMGERIKKLRKHIGVSQEAFATKLGLKQRTLSYMESGDRGILCSLVKKMHKEFGVNPLWIIFGEGEML